MDIHSYLDRQKSRVEEALELFLPRGDAFLSGHIDAMRYSLLGGGKRVRPVLCLAAAEAVRPDIDLGDILPVACALECIHSYSLIHDDLPAMDNDELRRGQPTSHRAFGEAAAILAGDGLLTFAFELLSDPRQTLPDLSRRLRIINIIARAAGPLGMVGGQVMDLNHEGRVTDLDTLQAIHKRKTGALISASVQAGALAAGADEDQITAIASYGNQIGLAFQIVDDLLDVTGNTEEMGKQAGADAARHKATYPALLGLDETKKRAQQTIRAALQALAPFPASAEPLRGLALYIAERSH